MVLVKFLKMEDNSELWAPRKRLVNWLSFITVPEQPLSEVKL